MKPETIDTITRHLKGIVAALEKEKEKGLPPFYNGKSIKDCTDTELKEALEYAENCNYNYDIRIKGYTAVMMEIESRKRSPYRVELQK